MLPEEAEARRKRAEEMREAIDEAAAGERAPASPREFTDKAARAAAEESSPPGPEDGEEER